MGEGSTLEREQIARANDSGRTPVVFVHGLWLLAASWDPWRAVFEEAGYATLAPGWPDDPDTVAEARRGPERLARKSLTQVTDHFAWVCRALSSRPAVVGHSFGGLVTEQLAGSGLSAASVAISPAPFRGVLPLPLSALRAAFPALRSPANYGRAITLTFEQFRFAFANAVGEEEARSLYDAHAVAAPAAPLFEAAAANLNPWTRVRVDTENPERGPLLVVSGDRDHTVPLAMARAAYGRQKRNPGLTQLVVVPGRGHALTIDSGWREVAEIALTFVTKHHPARTPARDEERAFPRPSEGPHASA
jgi:non-heme chloroperoxidase